LIKQISKYSNIPVITNLQAAKSLEGDAAAMLAREIELSRKYWLGLRQYGIVPKDEITAPIIL